MAIEWIESLMLKWGEYARGGHRFVMGGYCSPIYNPDKVKGTLKSNDLVLPELTDVDIIMASLKKTNYRLFQVGNELYFHGLSAKLAAGRIRCHIDTVYSRRDALHQLVEARLSMRRST